MNKEFVELYLGGYHISKSRNRKTDYDRQIKKD